MSSDLSKKFIANTYQKLIQVDNAFGATGSPEPFDTMTHLQDARTTTNYNLLNGLGQTKPYLVIDHTDRGNGGVFIKDSDKDPDGLWGVQIEATNGATGINFWRPSGSPDSGNYKMFLQNTGKLWLGFSNPGTVVNQQFYNLFARDGIHVGVQNNKDGLINITGMDPIGADGGLKINSEYPFQLRRYGPYNLSQDQDGDLTPFFTISSGGPTFMSQGYTPNKWIGIISGFSAIQPNNTRDFTTAIEVKLNKVPNPSPSGQWRLDLRFGLSGTIKRDISVIVDILWIKKGLYEDFT